MGLNLRVDVAGFLSFTIHSELGTNTGERGRTPVAQPLKFHSVVKTARPVHMAKQRFGRSLTLPKFASADDARIEPYGGCENILV